MKGASNKEEAHDSSLTQAVYDLMEDKQFDQLEIKEDTAPLSGKRGVRKSRANGGGGEHPTVKFDRKTVHKYIPSRQFYKNFSQVGKQHQHDYVSGDDDDDEKKKKSNNKKKRKRSDTDAGVDDVTTHISMLPAARRHASDLVAVAPQLRRLDDVMCEETINRQGVYPSSVICDDEEQLVCTCSLPQGKNKVGWCDITVCVCVFLLVYVMRVCLCDVCDVCVPVGVCDACVYVCSCWCM